MRIIAGSRRRMQLKTPEGKGVRPTTDRIKETLFNMLQNELYGCHFLDLFAGSGQMGLEALSRGAKHAVFVERDAKAAACIRANLESTGLSEQGLLLKMDAAAALRTLEGKHSFDVVFLDPPYEMSLEKEALAYLAGSSLLKEGAVLVVESGLGTDFSYLSELGYTVVKEKKYKTNQHLFLTWERKA